MAMMFFTLVPAFAPLIGSFIIAFSDWRGIFLAFCVFSMVSMLWMGLRLREPLPRERRRPFRVPQLLAALAEMASHPTVRLSILTQTLIMTMLFTMIVMVQPVYDQIFDRAESFPVWFMVVALMAGTASPINAALVGRFGMRRMVTSALAIQIVSSGLMLMKTGIVFGGNVDFYIFVAWQTTVFFMVGLTLGNLNAMAMEPMGHIAGMAASVAGGVATVVSAGLAAPIGQLFDGTLFPMVAGVLVPALAAFVTMLRMARVEAAMGAPA